MSGSTADRSPWASFPWVLASQQLSDERWERHSPWAGRGQGGPSCWMPFPHVASPDKCHKPPKVPPPSRHAFSSLLPAWLTSKQLSTEALWVFPFSSHLLEDEYLLWELHEIVTALQEKKENLMLLSSKNALLQLQSSLFVLPAPTPYKSFMYIYHGSYLEKR